MKEEDKKNKRRNLNAILVLIIVIYIFIMVLRRNIKQVSDFASIMPILLFAIIILIITLIAENQRYKKRFIDTRARKEILKKLFPQFYKEEDILEEIKQTKLNDSWKSFADEGTLEIKTEENLVKIYKYFTTKLGKYNREIELENGIMIKFCDIIKEPIPTPVYLRESDYYNIDISGVANALYKFAGVSATMEPASTKRVEMESDDFNMYFSVHCANELQAKMILTYEKMEKLLEIQKKIAKPMKIAYINRDVYVWIDDIRLMDSLKKRAKYNKNVEIELKKIVEDLPNIKESVQPNEN